MTTVGSVNNGTWHSVTWQQISNEVIVSFRNQNYPVKGNLSVYSTNISDTVNLYLGVRPIDPLSEFFIYSI